jgi:hypothetical protein
VPELELVQVHFHAVTLPDLPGDLHLVLRGPREDYCQIPSHDGHLCPYLVLRVIGEDSGYSRNDYDGFRVATGVPAFALAIAACHRRARS